MKNTRLFFLSVCCMLMGAFMEGFAAADPNFHIYLCFGQSNMEGQGNIESQDRSVDKRFQVLCSYDNCGSRKKGQWYDAVPPLSCCSGQHLGPVDYFGRTLVKNLPEHIRVGAIVVAVAGCDIQLFEKNNYKNYRAESYMQSTIQSYGGNPYGRLVEMAKEAQKVGVIKGILLHQGETNSGQQNWPSRVKAIYNDLINDLELNASDVPLLVGEVVRSEQGGQCGGMNSIIANVPSTIPNSYVISAQGLGNKGDGLHFSSASYRTLGERYAEQMLKVLKYDPNPPSGDSGSTTTGGQTSGEGSTVDSGVDPNFHIYLCFGQSNMEGQGPIENQDRSVDKRFQMMCSFDNCGSRKKGQWYDATPPLSCCSGNHLGPVDYFGRTLVKNLPEQVRVGVIVVAIAGCDIQLFEKNNYKSYNAQSYMQSTIQSYGGNPYGRLVEMAKEAQKVGVIKGILLHQGETNSGQQNWPSRVKAIYNDLISDLGLNASNVPLLVGEVVRSEQGGQCGGMNSIIANVPGTIPNSYVISAEGLGNQGDGLHFTSASYRTLGERYAGEMLKHLDMGSNPVTPPTPTEPDYTFDGNYLKIETEEMPIVGGEYCKPYNEQFSGMAYYANNDLTSASVEFSEAGTYEFVLKGCADATTAASVSFSVGSETATYEWSSSEPTEIVKKITVGKSGVYDIQLLMETDRGQSDAFVDYVLIRKEGYVSSAPSDASNAYLSSPYPNPTDGIVCVDGENISSLYVMDMLGVEIISSSSPCVDLSEFSSGTYFLRVNLNDGSSVIDKIIKK